MGGEEDVGGGELGRLCGRPIGDSDCPNSVTNPAGMVAGMSGVHTGPGATTLTLMPCCATSMASPLVKFTMAAFVEA